MVAEEYMQRLVCQLTCLSIKTHSLHTWGQCRGEPRHNRHRLLGPPTPTSGFARLSTPIDSSMATSSTGPPPPSSVILHHARTQGLLAVVATAAAARCHMTRATKATATMARTPRTVGKRTPTKLRLPPPVLPLMDATPTGAIRRGNGW